MTPFKYQLCESILKLLGWGNMAFEGTPEDEAVLKHKILKLAPDFALFQNVKRLYDEKKARGD